MENKTNSFALFRFPGEQKIQFIRGFSSKKLIELNKIPNDTFLFSPFNKGNKAYYFKFEKVNSLKKEISSIQNYSQNIYNNWGRKHYEDLVQKAINELEKGKINKIVLANSKTKSIGEIDLLALFKKVAKKYPNVFVYCLSTPITGTWIGASPEPLVRSINGKYQTVSLAGTIKNFNEKKWSNKEIIEQEIVSNFIENKLKKADIKYIKNKPYNYSNGDLTHLRTEYSFGLKQNKNRIEKLIKLINPTPAVGGLPRKQALKFISDNEKLNRSFYSGYIGTKSDDIYNLFVNLRCLELNKTYLTLFAGAGITKESIPHNEWVETQNKMQILESILN